MNRAFKMWHIHTLGASGGTVVKNLPANAGDARGAGSIPWRRKWQPLTVFLPGESHGRRSWAATVNPRDHKESDKTE